MKFSPGKHRKLIAGSAAAVAAIAAVSTYFAVSGNSTTSTAATKADTGGAVQFVAGATASGVKTSASPSKSPKPKKTKASAKPTTSHSATAQPTVEPGADIVQSSGSRSPYTWPFSWDSIWNIPIASTAQYASADIKSAGSFEDAAESDYDSVDPSFPTVSLPDARLASGDIGSVSVHSDPSMSADGTWNTCSAFLGSDNTSVYQGQTTELAQGGSPSFGGVADDASLPVSITGTGITGCHGGSGLSGLGGTLTLNDLTESGPITHALKVTFDGFTNYSGANGGFRWPAVNADTDYSDPSSGNYYGGSNPNVQEGSLLALPTSISPSSFSNPTVARLARAMQDYGAYIVDTTATGSYNFSSLITNYNAWSTLDSDLCSTGCGSPSSNTDIFSSELDTLFQDLDVVTNNTASTPGGGAIGASRCAPYAPEFSNGTGAPPAVAVTSC